MTKQVASSIQSSVQYTSYPMIQSSVQYTSYPMIQSSVQYTSYPMIQSSVQYTSYPMIQSSVQYTSYPMLCPKQVFMAWNKKSVENEFNRLKGLWEFIFHIECAGLTWAELRRIVPSSSRRTCSPRRSRDWRTWKRIDEIVDQISFFYLSVDV